MNLCQRAILENIVQKIQECDLFLFDLDGLLVDTEPVHYQAYQKMCLARGFSLTWDYAAYCDLAHKGSDLLEKGVYETFPDLKAQEPNWRVLHQEKQMAFLEIVADEGVSLMPGVEQMLQKFPLQSKRSCVVTHSSSQLTQALCRKLPILQTIPYWVTREQYSSAKPHPDAYLLAMRLYGKEGDKILGFEDSFRGYLALQAAGIPSVVISSILSSEFLKELDQKQVSYYNSFQDIII